MYMYMCISAAEQTDEPRVSGWGEGVLFFQNISGILDEDVEKAIKSNIHNNNKMIGTTKLLMIFSCLFLCVGVFHVFF